MRFNRFFAMPTHRSTLLNRFRQAVPSHRIPYFVHAGNSLAVCASCSDDMVPLRAFMIGATACNIAFNLLQPLPLWTPVYWGAFFCTVHATQIARIFADSQDVTLSEREHSLYESCFLSHGFTPRQFLTLLRNSDAAWVSYSSGECIAQAGTKISAIHLVLPGSGTGACVFVDKKGPGDQNESSINGTESGAPAAPAQCGLRRLSSNSDGVIARVQSGSIRHGLWIGDVWEPDDPTHCVKCACSEQYMRVQSMKS